MTDYISREAAIAELNAEGYTKNMRIHKRILSIPAADVRPVQVCQKCGEEHVWIDYRPAFCECCGADMRKVIEIEQVKEDAE